MNNLHKVLETRHINMIALGGSIGTGLFLASGYSIALGGPGGAIFGYLLMSIIVYFLMTSLGEMSVHSPSSGSLCSYSYAYVSESFGFAMGYNYWLSWAITIAAEISAASLVMAYWFPTIPSIYFTVTFFTLIILLNVASVKWYGESEYILAFIKVAIIIIFIIVGFFSLLHQPRFGVHNLYIGDAPFHHGLFGLVSVFLLSGYAFQGTELIGIAAGESREPEKSIPQAVKMVFWRLTFFYILSITIVSLLIPYTDSSLLNQNNVSTSPFTHVFSQYISIYAGNIMNFIILVALISAANASLYSSTRILWYLSKKSGRKNLAQVNRQGVPLKALLVTAFVGSIAFLCSFIGNGKLFYMLVTIASISCFVSWLGIAWSHYKFRKDYLPKVGGLSILKYKARFFPYAQIISIVMLLIIILAQFLTFDSNTDFWDKLSVYFGVIPFIILYIFHKLRTRIKLTKNS